MRRPPVLLDHHTPSSGLQQSPTIYRWVQHFAPEMERRLRWQWRRPQSRSWRIGTARLNDIDPQAWLANVVGKIADLPQTRPHELLPWHWTAERQISIAA